VKNRLNGIGDKVQICDIPNAPARDNTSAETLNGQRQLADMLHVAAGVNHDRALPIALSAQPPSITDGHAVTSRGSRQEGDNLVGGMRPEQSPGLFRSERFSNHVAAPS